MAADPTGLTLGEGSRAIAEGRLSPVALTGAYLERIAALDGKLHSYVLVLRDEALAAARALGAAPVRGPLHGIPIGLKDIYKTRGIRTTAGSRRYLDHVPDEDAESWVRLREAGAILLGKQETHEFAIGGPPTFCCRFRRRAIRGTPRITRPGRLGGRRRRRTVRRGDGL
jgi:aspartyl-tRNA(Asn)/glutamyl-tRNA(Gln) amidotransferase subunit A